MELNIVNEVATLERLSVGQLRHRFAELFGETTRASNRTWLIKRIAWRLQALAEGDLSERARRRAAELARDADLRLNPPQRKATTPTPPPEPVHISAPVDQRLPPPGTILARPYKGQLVQVQVLTDGFAYAGRVYPSLSAVAKAITGSHCNWLSLLPQHPQQQEGDRMNHPNKKAAATLPLVRCAIYTRKSTEEGLEQEFNSLDAQRESAEAFIRSQTHEGWTCLPTRYDDGGFTGGNMDRPALQRLLADIAVGKIDLVVTYKVDRLSRSLLDFAKMMETFEQHGVSFVSITQQFNSATSMGRLVLNVLLSFAQFEREIIAERTRDKMAAIRRKGKWSGGMPVLGYDLDPRGRRLHVNDEEAARVRGIFALYLEHEALLPVVQELARRGWVGKCWRTRHGRQRGGRPFTKTSLYRLLTNVLYAGKVRYKNEIHDGEQPALIDTDTFQRVQALLKSHGPEVGPPSLQRFTALLKGLLRCLPCDCAMTAAHTTRKGGLRYRYYTCVHAQKSGWQSCPSKSIPAQPIEQLVIDQIQRLGRDPLVLEQMLTTVRQQDEARVAEWEGERVGLERDLLRGQSEVRKLLAEVSLGTSSKAAVTRLAELQARLAQIVQRLARLRGQMEALHQERLDQAAVTEALSGLVPAWERMAPHEQARVVRLLVSRVDYDGKNGKASITFQPLGLKTLAAEVLGRKSEEQSA